MGVYDLSYQEKVLIAANRIASSYPNGRFGYTLNYDGPDLIITPWEEKDNIGRIKLEPIKVKDDCIISRNELVSMLEEILAELDKEAYEYSEAMG